MNGVQVRKILRNIYKINYENITIPNKGEFLVNARNGSSEFSQMLKKVDTDNGVIVTPSGYVNGIFYSVNNDGEIYCDNTQTPDITNFAFNIYGLKKNCFYRIMIIARDTGANTFITDDRNIMVTDDTKQIIISTNVKGFDKNQECVGFFRSMSTEVNLLFTLGKVIIKDIIIDEVYLAEEEKIEENSNITEEFGDNKEVLVSYGIYSLVCDRPNNFAGKYILLHKYSGKGIELFYNTQENTYVLERSNVDTIVQDPFTNINYKIDINTNKLPNNDTFDSVRTINISTDISPNTLKQGYIEFAFYKHGERVKYNNSLGRLFISIYQYK